MLLTKSDTHKQRDKRPWLIETETNGRQFADDIFKSIFLNEKVWTPIKISLKFVSKGLINIILALDQIMAWRRLNELTEWLFLRRLSYV